MDCDMPRGRLPTVGGGSRLRRSEGPRESWRDGRRPVRERASVAGRASARKSYGHSMQISSSSAGFACTLVTMALC